MKETERLLTPDDAAAYLGVTRRRLLQLPIKQVRISERTIRYRMVDITTYLGLGS